MSLYNLRFKLSNNNKFYNNQEIKNLLNHVPFTKIIRVATNIEQSNESISILAETKHPDEALNHITAQLSLKGISVAPSPEIEVLSTQQDGNQIFNHQCYHGCQHNHHAHGEHDHHHEHNHHHEHDHHHENHRLKASVGLLWGIGLIILSLSGIGLPFAATLLVNSLTTAMTLYLGFNVYKSAWKNLLESKINGSTLYSISTITISVVSTLGLFIPGLPIMLEAAPLVLGFWHLGEYIEHSLLSKITKKLDIRDHLPKYVTLKGTPDQKIEVSTLIPNDIIRIKKGKIIPVNGVLLTDTLLYTTRIDGSPYLKLFKAGDMVKSGMCLAPNAPAAQIRVTKTYQNSYLSLVAKNISKANEQKAPIETFAEKVLQYFVPALLTVATTSGILISAFINPAIATQCVVSILVSACPCVLSLITPLAVKIGMNKASEYGIQFKDGKAIQASADIDAVVFDLNGTLSQGVPTVDAIKVSAEKYLHYIAKLEQDSAHPVAQIIGAHINTMKKNTSYKFDISEIEHNHHSGIKGVIDGKKLLVGSKDLLIAHGINNINPPYNNPQNGQVYVAYDGSVVGQISIHDPLRQDAISTIQKLKNLGKQVHICTGADIETAQRYATILDIPLENICANAEGTSEENSTKISKQNYIKQLQSRGLKVAMIGDAANDAEAIASSDIGIAVQSPIGNSETEAEAGIIVQQGLLFPIATAFDVAHQTKNSIYQNLFISLFYNSSITLVGSGLFLGLGFSLNPAVGVALMVVESSVVLLNINFLKNKEVVTNDDLLKPELNASSSTATLMHHLAYQPSSTLQASIQQEPSTKMSCTLAKAPISKNNMACANEELNSTTLSQLSL